MIFLSMKRFLLISGLSVLLAVFLFGLIGSLLVIRKNNAADQKLFAADTNRKWHTAVFLPTLEDPFFQQLDQGILKGAAEYGIAAEFQTPQDNLTINEDFIRFLEIAKLSKVDAVALYVTDEELLTPYIDALALNDIPVITLESDAPRSRRTSFIGTNGFEVGREVGNMMKQAEPEGVVGAIVKGEHVSDRSSKWNVMYYGILASLTENGGNHIQTTMNSNSGFLSAEQVTRRILFLFPKVNTIFFTDAQDAAVASHIITETDQNRKPKIISYGMNILIEEGINNGLVYGTVYNDPEEIGYKAMETIYLLKTNQYAPSLRFTGIKTKKCTDKTQ